MNALREHVIEKLAHTLDLSKNDTIVVNLEKSILNHVTERVEKTKTPTGPPKHVFHQRCQMWRECRMENKGVRGMG